MQTPDPAEPLSTGQISKEFFDSLFFRGPGSHQPNYGMPIACRCPDMEPVFSSEAIDDGVGKNREYLVSCGRTQKPVAACLDALR